MSDEQGSRDWRQEEKEQLNSFIRNMTPSEEAEARAALAGKPLSRKLLGGAVILAIAIWVWHPAGVCLAILWMGHIASTIRANFRVHVWSPLKAALYGAWWGLQNGAAVGICSGFLVRSLSLKLLFAILGLYPVWYVSYFKLTNEALASVADRHLENFRFIAGVGLLVYVLATAFLLISSR